MNHLVLTMLIFSSRAFVMDRKDKNMKTILARDDKVESGKLGRKENLSALDIVKIKKMYKCPPYQDWWVTFLFCLSAFSKS